MRQTLIAAMLGLMAGVVAAVVLWLMERVSGVIWSGPQTRWYIFVIIMIGGGLIVLLRHRYEGEGLSQQIAETRAPPQHGHWRNTALLAAMGIVAVGFGGAVGPEAGILAVVGELSGIVTLLIARNQDEARLIGEAGAAGALGGLYGSPPGGAVMAQEHPEAPKWQLYLAALTGLLGFLWVTGRLLPDAAIRIHLPPVEPATDGTDILMAVLPAILGAIAGLAFVVMLPFVTAALKKMGGIGVQTMVGTALFALLAAAVPILRFSGHHQLDQMLEWGKQAGMGPLMLLALLKSLALALCLAAGWRGGAVFPLLFAGAAAGAAALWITPEVPVTVALVGGMAAAMTCGMGKPVAAMLIALLLIGTVAVGPLCTGALIGWMASQLVPRAGLH